MVINMNELKTVKEFWREEDGMGTVEVILIIVVLVGLVLIFKEQITKIVDAVETEVFNMEQKEIPSRAIGEIVMDKMKNLDPVAYFRFASVYREFKDIDTFMDELQKMLQAK